MNPGIKSIIGGLFLALHSLAFAALPASDGQSPGVSISAAQRYGLFQESLVASRTPTAEEQGDLQDAVGAYRAAGQASDIEALRLSSTIPTRPGAPPCS